MYRNMIYSGFIINTRKKQTLHSKNISDTYLFGMSSVLSSFFSRDVKTTFPFDLPNESFTTVQSDIFVGKSFRKTDPSEKSTCFWSSTAGGMLKAQAQKLKTLRHPNVLTYIDSLEVNGTFFLITEPCRPLAYYLNENKLTDTQRELFVSWGLYQLLNCLKFLHNEAQISQNNLKNAIFVTESGDWKLAAFHLSGNFSSAQTDLNDMASVLLGIFGDKSAITHSPENALQQIPRRLQPLYKRLCAKGKSVMAVTDMLHESRSVGGFMKNKFVDTLLFLDEFQLREAAERQSFFAQLNQNLDLFPADIARNKILPKLVHVYEYGDAGAHILVPMFKLGRLLQEEEYQQKIVPCLVKLFSSTDRTTRVKLLERIDEFAGHLKPPVVNEKIYSNLVTGFLDSNSAVRESTVKAMVVIADKLNYNNLNTDLMKYLARLQGSDPEPGIRTNTTICLGKIGCYIDPSHRQRILISAFTRALRDPFPPARMAGVIALSATQQYFSLCEVAQKVLPALAPLTVDPEKQVRDQSFKAMSGFLEKLQKASDNPHLIPELEAQVKAGGKGGLLSGDKVPQWAGWAIKAISGKFYKSKESPATETEGTAATTTEVRPPLAQLQTKGGEKESTAETHSRTASICSSSHSSISARGETTNSSAVADGWGELLDEEEEEERGLEGSEGSSDSGGERRIPKKNNQEREDALWSAAMDSWESTSTPSPNKKAGSLKPNMAVCAPNKLSPPFSLSTTSANEPQQQSPSPAKKSSGFAAKPEKQQKGAALKLGAVKKPAHAQQSKQIDKDLDTLLGMEDTRSSEEKKLDKSVKDGNFASVAKQISQQQPKPPVQKQQKEKVEGASNWQEW